MTSHVIAYRSLELLFGTHTFNFNCFFEDFNCVFTQIRKYPAYLGCCTSAAYIKVHFRQDYFHGSKVSNMNPDQTAPL